jgi:RNA polymerase-binding transcription factor DksA
MAKSKPQKKDESSKNGHIDSAELVNQQITPPSTEDGDESVPPFLRKQKSKLLQLRDTLLDSMMGVSRDTLRSRAEGSEASAFGMHQADAGSDAYDRDFALSLLSQEQDALYEIEEALKRVDAGTYGTCEMSGKPIPHARLEAIPFARFTVECQTQIEKQKKALRVRQPVTSLFGLTDEEGGEGEEEDTITDSKD